MAFPSTLSSFNRPTATNKLNSPSHSALHNTVSSALGQVEAVIGVEGASSVVGSLQYLIKSSASDGGGHVQTANKGGTGQTSYTKGDILVATSSSVITKLAIGTDGQVIKANSSTASGINWAAETNTLPKVGVSGSVLTLANSTTETSILSTTVTGSVLGTNNALRARVFVSATEFGSNGNLNFKAHYGGTSIVAINLVGSNSSHNEKGVIEFNLIAANAVNSQRGNFQAVLLRDRAYTADASVIGVNVFTSGVLSVDSGASQTLGITAAWSAAASNDSITFNGWTVEKIT